MAATGQIVEHALGFYGAAALLSGGVAYRRAAQFAHGPPAQMGDCGVFLVPWDYVPLRPPPEAGEEEVLVAVTGTLRRGSWGQLPGRQPEEIVSVRWIYTCDDVAPRKRNGLRPSDCALSNLYGDLPLAWLVGTAQVVVRGDETGRFKIRKLHPCSPLIVLIGNPTRRPIQRLTITHFLKANGSCVKLGTEAAQGLGWVGWDVEPALPRLVLRPLKLEKLCASQQKRKAFELEDVDELELANTLQCAAPAITRCMLAYVID